MAATRAYEIMQRYQHTQLDTEHMLLALLEQPEGIVHACSDDLSVDRRGAQHALDDVLQGQRHVWRRRATRSPSRSISRRASSG